MVMWWWSMIVEWNGVDEYFSVAETLIISTNNERFIFLAHNFSKKGFIFLAHNFSIDYRYSYCCDY